MLVPYIKQLMRGQDLTANDSLLAGQILLNQAPKAQIAAFITLLATKGETVNELLGLVNAIKEQAINLNFNKPVLDIVGTGGDGAYTLNISTAAALLTASCGVPVVKHGNRAISSKCGSADVLEALGYPINLPPAELITSLNQINFGFCYAPNYHPVLASVKEVRNELKFPTIFNLLGPLLNPAGTEHLVLGVYDPQRVKLIAETLFKLGTTRSIVFHGNGLDELSCIGTIQALLVTATGIQELEINPFKLGLRPCTLTDIKGADANYNAILLSQTLSGADTGLTDTIVLNTAVALYLYGTVATLETGIELTRKRLATGNILKPNMLQQIIQRKRRPTIKRKSLKAAIMAKTGPAVISEIKRASPSAGKIAEISDPIARALSYVNAGAAAVSVLTDEGFEGSMADLAQVAHALRDTKAAILCKDFILCPEQIAEAAAAGADAILLMVSVLHHNIKPMVEIAHAFGLEALVEVHSPAELPIALASGGDLIGVNQRNLSDFSMHPEIFSQVIKQIPAHIIKIAESGMKTHADVQKAYNLGYNAVLVGEALSRLAEPEQFFDNLRGQNVN